MGVKRAGKAMVEASMAGVVGFQAEMEETKASSRPGNPGRRRICICFPRCGSDPRTTTGRAAEVATEMVRVAVAVASRGAAVVQRVAAAPTATKVARAVAWRVEVGMAEGAEGSVEETQEVAAMAAEVLEEWAALVAETEGTAVETEEVAMAAR